jgi:hypothetical protein
MSMRKQGIWPSFWYWLICQSRAVPTKEAIGRLQAIEEFRTEIQADRLLLIEVSAITTKKHNNWNIEFRNCVRNQNNYY